MKLMHTKCIFKDKRGEIRDILIKERIDYVTIITNKKGCIRGNHYHKKTFQWVYIIEGRMKFLTQMPGEPVVATVLKKGDLMMTEPMERHAMVALTDYIFIVFTRGVRGGKDYEKDTCRLKKPLEVLVR